VQVLSEGFPGDFSIIAVLRSSQAFSRVPVFSIYNQDSEEVLVLFVGSEIAVVYQDTDGEIIEDNLISFEASTNDLKWHRIGISFKGDSITLIFDCAKQINKKLPRSANPKLATDGLIFMGVQLDEEEEYFMVNSF
jgi:collagen type V/XI/XXIV/XXVII, alpha